MAFTQELKFSDLTRLLEALSTTKEVKKRDKYAENYFKTLLNFRNEFVNRNKNADSSLLPVIRLILAQEEKERSYGIQEKSLRQLYIKALNLHKNNLDAIKLTQCSEEDLANNVYEVMKTRTSEGSLSIYEVEESLNFISMNQKQALQENELRKLIIKSNAIDQKWLAKIILKRMHLQIGTVKILKFYHPLAHPLFLKHNHLTKVVELIETGQAEKAMIEASIIFEPIRSMLCQKFTPTLNKDFLQKTEMFQETKMDGERFQLHMKNGDYRYYSRNGHRYLDGFDQMLTPLIKFTPIVHSIILDGEMLVYDKTDRRYHTKGETAIDVKYMKDSSSNLRPCFCVFDVLLYNDQDFINRPYSQRYQLLNQLFEDQEGVMVKTKPIKIRDVDHMVDLLNIAIDNKEEGIILKDAESIYKPGDRAGGWYKVKPDYFEDGVVEPFDCVVIGGYYENPYSKNFIQRYMLGAVEKADDEKYNIYAIGEVTHGFKVQERMNINEKLKPYLVEHLGEKEVSFGSGKIIFGRNKPHVWIPPDQSIILQVRASELARSSEQYGKFTFRFPRIDHVRDNRWEESYTFKEFLEMSESVDGQVKKTVQRKVHKTDIVSPSRKRKQGSSAASVIADFCNNSEEADDFKLVDNCLEGKEFCVLTTDPKLPPISEMKTMIKQHGGTITLHPRKGKTFAIVAGQLKTSVKAYLKDKTINVIKGDWLVNNFSGEERVHKEMPKLRPVVDVHFATEQLKDSMKEFFDEFGDSYAEPFESVEELKVFVNKMEQKGSDEDYKEMELELCKHGLGNKNIFRNVSAVFMTTKEDNFLFESAKNVLEIRAGKELALKDVKLNQKSIVIIDKRDDLQKVKQQLSELKVRNANYVDFNWILDSSDAGEVLDQEIYNVFV